MLVVQTVQLLHHVMTVGGAEPKLPVPTPPASFPDRVAAFSGSAQFSPSYQLDSHPATYELINRQKFHSQSYNVFLC